MRWWWNLLSKWAVEPLPEKPKPMPVQKPEVGYIPLNKNQYRTDKYKKTHIFIHHSAGGSAAGAISGWNATPERVATPYIIERTGDIYEVYSPELWANHLGGKVPISLERSSIGIEMVAYGPLTQKVNGDLVTYTGRVIPKEKAVKCDFRGFQYYEQYTPEQIAALGKLLPWLIDHFQIKLQADRKNFWEYQGPNPGPGIWSHTSVRKDKFDIFPQKELVDLVYGL